MQQINQGLRGIVKERKVMERCKSCEGTGVLGFQKETCWFCCGTGETEKRGAE